MQKIIKTEKLPIYSWAKEIEVGALTQARNLANLPIAFHHIAIMSDVHEGYGMPIGGILATKNSIVCNAVGVDIGCGVRACETEISFKNIELLLERIISDIARSIPSGFSHHQEPQSADLFYHPPKSPVIEEELESAKHQLGTLGGGNHFLEILKDSKDKIWLAVHSGSRNFGYKTAQYYHHKALVKHPAYRDLAWLEMGDLGREYYDAMNFCVEFARQNRVRMLEVILESLKRYFGDFEHQLPIDVHHNYCSREEHFGEELYIHRKGAVKANKDDLVIIPGTMGTCSYVARGLGNEKSFCSSSHGAGRRMSRTQARKEFNFSQIKKELAESKILISASHKSQAVEEAPGAYKDIKEVITLQKDVIEVVEELRPIGVVVG
ncbi:MAG: tRNA-splicing ligase RtcB [Candidatus Berkelbacteria bacterium Licking1014_96]|uniref:3'-phosphate/5'-hydroxy nucleic acid ligase n=1 Tax=Candidatus Berkelbacteria bacterium Licking1014_96 TaxID=2017149 RepID=A0A554LHJ0_9BACT|nr:MAG: tRNA-splicing ligase RtcB [Candidatus Berkelbacteria bacterium Licking1014_96]